MCFVIGYMSNLHQNMIMIIQIEKIHFIGYMSNLRPNMIMIIRIEKFHFLHAKP